MFQEPCFIVLIFHIPFLIAEWGGTKKGGYNDLKNCVVERNATDQF
jgi:hypothetical protein